MDLPFRSIVFLLQKGVFKAIDIKKDLSYVETGKWNTNQEK